MTNHQSFLLPGTVKRICQLPTVESQTLAFVEAAKRTGEWHEMEIEAGGFYVHIKYAPVLYLDPLLFRRTKARLKNTVSIYAVRIPDAQQRKGWFLRYCQLCSLLVGEALIVDNVEIPTLRNRLASVGFVPDGRRSMVLQRSQPDDGSPLLRLGDIFADSDNR